MGWAQVLIDGVGAATIDLDAASTSYRRVFRKGFTGCAKHSIESGAVGDGRVELDAAVVLR